MTSNLPRDVTTKPDKFLTWKYVGPSARKRVYDHAYAFKSRGWHLSQEDRRVAVSAPGSSDVRKSYIQEPDHETPLYFPLYATRVDRRYAGRAPASEAPTAPAAPTSSSKKARDTRRANKIVAQEEARVGEFARAMKPVPSKTLKRTVSIKLKGGVVIHRRVESDDKDSDDKWSPKPRGISVVRNKSPRTVLEVVILSASSTPVPHPIQSSIQTQGRRSKLLETGAKAENGEYPAGT
ncbi:unnamed protein product [Rhizoctonia solani]|uniref:Uncharacterized protein n=1 Tax=Rhizoctonia solani TaxID=456999 RepID=A0A8H3AR62_9AGAM|nr:unnamed protein product [Rhizoctonia solani]